MIDKAADWLAELYDTLEPPPNNGCRGSDGTPARDKQIAELTGVSERTIRAIRRRERKGITLDTADRIALACGRSLWELEDA